MARRVLLGGCNGATDGGDIATRARRTSGTTSRRCSARLLVTPLGLERVLVATSIREDPPVSDGEPQFEQDARGHERTRAVASLATALAEAVVAGDHERARALAEEVRALHRVAGAPGAIVASNGYNRRR